MNKISSEKSVSYLINRAGQAKIVANQTVLQQAAKCERACIKKLLNACIQPITVHGLQNILSQNIKAAEVQPKQLAIGTLTSSANNFTPKQATNIAMNQVVKLSTGYIDSNTQLSHLSCSSLDHGGTPPNKLAKQGAALLPYKCSLMYSDPFARLKAIAPKANAVHRKKHLKTCVSSGISFMMHQKQFLRQGH